MRSFPIALGLSVLFPTLSSATGMTAPRPLLHAESTQKAARDDLADGWWLFGGAGSGYGLVRGSEFSRSPHGAQVNFSGLVSYLEPDWVADLGASWYYSRLEGHDSLTRDIRITTHAGSIDLSPRLRLGRHWQLGPAVNVAFGTDTEFGPTVGNSIATAFVGLRTVHERMISGYPVRFWQQLSTDVSIVGRQAYLGTLGVQVGLPLSLKSELPGGVAGASGQREDARTKISGVEKAAPVVRVVLDPQRVFFGTNSSRVRPRVEKALRELGTYLESAPENWTQVAVSGHADVRGSYRYNLKLSKARAQAVSNALEPGANLGTRIKVSGLSFSRPVDQRNVPEAWAKNRRVELEFHGVKDAARLRAHCKKLMEAMNETLN